MVSLECVSFDYRMFYCSRTLSWETVLHLWGIWGFDVIIQFVLIFVSHKLLSRPPRTTTNWENHIAEASGKFTLLIYCQSSVSFHGAFFLFSLSHEKFKIKTWLVGSVFFFFSDSFWFKFSFFFKSVFWQVFLQTRRRGISSPNSQCKTRLPLLSLHASVQNKCTLDVVCSFLKNFFWQGNSKVWLCWDQSTFYTGYKVGTVRVKSIGGVKYAITADSNQRDI